MKRTIQKVYVDQKSFINIDAFETIEDCIYKEIGDKPFILDHKQNCINPIVCFRYIKECADEGCPISLWNLGYIYYNGRIGICEQDIHMALMYLKKASDIDKAFLYPLALLTLGYQESSIRCIYRLPPINTLKFKTYRRICYSGFLDPEDSQYQILLNKV